MAYTIMLDAGHGGDDPGALYQDRREKDDTLRLTLELGKILEENGVNVLYTRTTDLYQTPFEKALIANRSGADYFISIHRNSSPTPNQYDGVETLVYDKSGIKLEMAENINAALEELGLTNLGVRARPGLVVLRRTQMPALLVEVGFINSDIDNELFDENFEAIAKAIAYAILQTLDVENVMDERVPQPRQMMTTDTFQRNEEQMNTPMSNNSQNRRNAPMPNNSQNRMVSPMPNNSQNQETAPVPNNSQNQRNTPMSNNSRNQGTAPMPGNSQDQRMNPMPNNSQNQGAAPMPNNSWDQMPSTPMPNNAQGQTMTTPMSNNAQNQPNRPWRPDFPEQPEIDETSPLYRVQVGLFRQRQYADNLLYELLEKGYPAFLLSEDGFFKIQVGAYRQLGNAITMERRLRREGYATLITT